MANLYALGARQRKLLIKDDWEWNLYEAALILQIDTNSGAVHTCVEYASPPEVLASERSSIVFKAGTLVGDTLYVCTSTEILIFKLPEFRRVGYVSLPCFNDLHHVTPSRDGELLVANTGLDMVVKASMRGDLLDEWSVLAEDPWARFSRSVDYRKVASTKPHKSHPNFVFTLNDEIWVTRFRQCDAICLLDRGKRINLGSQFPHDGLVCGERIYFTLVDGTIVVANSRSLQVEEVIDLKYINGQRELLGWCRGLLPSGDRKLWVGFTRIRKTRFRENILWVRNVLQDGMRERATHIALYDLAKKQCIQQIDLEHHGMNLVFSILPATDNKATQQMEASTPDSALPLTYQNSIATVP